MPMPEDCLGTGRHCQGKMILQVFIWTSGVYKSTSNWILINNRMLQKAWIQGRSRPSLSFIILMKLDHL